MKIVEIFNIFKIENNILYVVTSMSSKVSRTVWRRGRGGDNIKALPIPTCLIMKNQEET